MRPRTLLMCVVSASLTAFLGSAVLAEDIIFDTFSDGSFTDGNPGTWQNAYGRWVANVESGDLNARISSGGGDGFTLSERLEGDVSIRAQVRIKNEEAGFGLVIHFQGGGRPPLNDGYYIGLGLDGLFGGDRFANGVRTNYTLLQLDEFADIADRDVVMQLDSVRDMLYGWVWMAEDSPPATPQLTIHLDEAPLLEDGFTGVWMNPGGNATIRHIQISDSPIPVPEPSSLLLLAAGVIACIGARRQTWHS